MTDKTKDDASSQQKNEIGITPMFRALREAEMERYEKFQKRLDDSILNKSEVKARHFRR